MTTLTATAVITAVDRASAVFARVGANASRLGGRFASAAGGVSRFGQSALSTLGVPAAMIGAMSGRAEYEVDKMGRLMQAAGELNDQQRKMLTETAFDVSTKTGQSAVDVLKGQRELILGGLDADTAAQTSELIAKVSRANDIAGEKVAEDAITNASALGLAMGTTEEKVASLRKTLDFMSTVPAFSPMSWSDLSTAMKYTGPVAGALKMQMKDLGAALSMLAFSGFKGEEAGTALRTILTRLIAPTKKARIELRAAGIDAGEMFNIDETKLNDKKTLLDALTGQGLMTASERTHAEKALSRVDARKFKGNTSGYTDALNGVLVKALGLGRGDTQDREVLKAAIDNHLFRAVGDMDLEKAFTALKKLPLKGVKEMAGLQRLSQAKALINKINEIVTLPSGERISAWKKLREEIGATIDGASDRKAEATLHGFWSAVDKVSTSFSNMSHQIFASGFGGEIEGIFQRLGKSINDIAKTDPERLRQIGWGLTALTVAPAAGFAASGIVALGGAFLSLGRGLTLAATAFARAPMLKKLLMGGGLAGLALGFADIGALFDGQGESAANGAILSRKVAPIMEFWSSVKGLGGELAGLFADVQARVQPLVDALKSLFNLNPSDSILVTGLLAIGAALDKAKTSVEAIRKVARGEETPLTLGAKERDKAVLQGPQGDGLDWLRDQMLRLQYGKGGMFKNNHAPLSGLQPLSLLPHSDPAAWNERAPPAVDRMSFGAGMAPMLQPQNVNVHGAFNGTVNSVIEVRYVGPIAGQQQISTTTSVAGELNHGESSLDLENH